MSIALLWTHPHYETRTRDNSIYNYELRETLPLHVPAFFMRAQKGPIGVPVYCPTIDYAKSIFGKGTFDKNTKYYSREAVFTKVAFRRQGVYIVRLAEQTAQYASAVLECHVADAAIKQWERDANGEFKLNESGAKIAIIDNETSQQTTKPGTVLTWKVRPLTTEETYTGLTVKTITDTLGGGGTVTVYPVMSFRATSPGAYGNDVGFKLYFDKEAIEATMVDTIDALTYMFSAVEKTYGQDTVTAVSTTFGDKSVLFALKSKAVDTRLDRDMAASAILSSSYYNKTYQQSSLPFVTKVYSDNVKLIGDKVLVKEQAEDVTVDGPFMMNLFSCTNIHGVPLRTVELSATVAENVVMLNKNYIIYLSGGVDGEMTDTVIEGLTVQYLTEDVYPEIRDSARYPITHVYDTGVTLPTKKALVSFLGVRDDVKVILSTQDCTRGKWNTKDEDMSIGASLHAACVLQPESTIFGTEAFRAEIYQQAGYLNDTTEYDGLLPMTLDALEKRCRWQSQAYIEGMPKGLPESAVTMFGSWNWTPSQSAHKQQSWETGLNYFQHYNRKNIHYPDIRSVYRYDTSVLSSAIFGDAVVYVKHIVRMNWAKHAGLELPFAKLAELAGGRVTNDVQFMLNNLYDCEVSFYQTEEEAKIGFIAHATVKLIGRGTSRVWLVDIDCYRDGYTAEA